MEIATTSMVYSACMKKKKNKLYENLYRLTDQLLSGKGYKPLTFEEIVVKLSLPSQHKDTVRQVLSHMIAEGKSSLADKRYLSRASGTEIAQGVLRVHHRGFAFLSADDKARFPQDIFVPRHLTQNAVDGDRVEVEVNTARVSEKGPEGKVLAILERSRTHLAGTIARTSEKEPIAYVPLLGESKRVIVKSDERLEVGDRVVLEVLEWGRADGDTLARLSHKIGHINDPATDIPAAIEEYELKKEFPSAVVEEAESYPQKIVYAKKDGRKDFRDLECVTIDPDTAKDFDDALNLSKDERGHYHLGVHIADVSYYVTPGSELDKEAERRANSTYFPGYCLPMLPRALSENLCSLKPNVVRYAASVMMEFGPTGDLLRYDICRSVIKSKKRFTYREAKKVIDGEAESPHRDLLLLMCEFCAHLKKARYERGSIEFSIPELAILVDERGEPVGTDFIPYDITHQMVEEFMLKANEVVARHLSDLGLPLAYRVHEEPADESMKEFSALVGAFGYKLPENPTPKELQELFDEVMQTSWGEYLATNYIRRMRMALYSPQNIGHFGLGLTHYCHFTSPIRRYADLLVHRTLFEKAMPLEHLEAISRYCSEQERVSEKAENSVILLKKLRLLQQMSEKEADKVFEAVITRVKPFGILFEVLNLMLEGYLHISELEDDYFEYSDATLSLLGSHTGKEHIAGNKIRVILKGIDFIYKQASFKLVEGRGEKKKSPKRGISKKSKRR